MIVLTVMNKKRLIVNQDLTKTEGLSEIKYIF